MIEGSGNDKGRVLTHKGKRQYSQSHKDGIRVNPKIRLHPLGIVKDEVVDAVQGRMALVDHHEYQEGIDNHGQLGRSGKICHVLVTKKIEIK